MIRRHAPDIPTPKVDDSPFLKPAHRYLACLSRHGRDLALETVTQTLRLANEAPPVIRLIMLGDGDTAIPATRLELSDGSTVTHSAWIKSFDGVVLEMSVAGGLHGDCRLEIMTGLDEHPTDVVPDETSEDAALANALRALECMRLHLELSMSYPGQEDDEQEAASMAEAETAAALSLDPVHDDMMHVRRATPWSTIRVIDSEPHRDLLDAEGVAAMPECESVLFVSATGDGSDARVGWMGRFVDVPDTLERLRTLAATTRRGP